MAVVTYKDQKNTKVIQKTQVFSGFSTQGREFKDPKLYDIELVKQDLLNHFNIRKGEKLENPEFGTNIYAYIFDPLDADTKNTIIQEVEDVVTYDPRVQLDQVEVNEKSKKLNVIDGSIQSKEREIPEYIELDGKSKTVKLIRIPKFSEVPYKEWEQLSSLRKSMVVLIKIETKNEYNKIQSTRNYFELCLTVYTSDKK